MAPTAGGKRLPPHSRGRYLPAVAQAANGKAATPASRRCPAGALRKQDTKIYHEYRLSEFQADRNRRPRLSVAEDQ